MNHPPDSLARRLAALRARMDAAAVAAGRDPAGVKLLAVSKTFPPAAVAEALRAGLTAFGESRMQEALPKMDAVAALPEAAGRAVQWHLIGHLQANKARKAVGAFALIHSVDSAELAQRIDRIAAELGVVQDVLLQVNASGEAQKHGIDPDRALALAALAGKLPHIRVRGLMGMAAAGGDPATAFGTLAGLFRHIAHAAPEGVVMAELSMGMSGDFEAAIAHGATIVRVGGALFGERHP